MAKKRKIKFLTFLAEYQAPVKKKKLSPPTEAQLIQQEKFGMAVGFIKHIQEMIGIGYSQMKLGNMTIQNYVTRDILANAMIGDDAGAKIDYSKVRLSNGRLEYVLVFYSAIDDKGSLRLIWEVYDTLGEVDSGEGNDHVCVFIYNETKDCSHTFKNAAERADLQVDLQIPSYDKDDICHCWMFVRSKDEKQVSFTGYYGNLDDFC